MIVDPYKNHPSPPRVALLLNGEQAIGEDGEFHRLLNLPQDMRVFGSHEQVWDLLFTQGVGEALCWENEPIKWRPTKLKEPGWINRGSDVRVLRLDFPFDTRQALNGLIRWRDWLADYGASPQGSLGGSAWSLLRARLGRTLFTSGGEPPPIRATIGGRMEVGPQGAPASFQGRLQHWDLPAAYANVIGGLQYGGWWNRLPSNATQAHLDSLAVDHVVFARCRVDIPEQHIGPLPERPRGRIHGRLAWLFDPVPYPTGRTMQGVWTWAELQAARDHGCHIRLLEAWLHLPDPTHRYPFRPWLESVKAGRDMKGFAGAMAKATGNALWGQFVISSGRRTVNGWTKENGENRYARSKRVPTKGGRPRAYDLGEYVTGLVRAELYRFMAGSGPRLICAHTDGGWIQQTSFDPYEREGWRVKETATQLRLIGPQTLAYKQGDRGRWRYVVSGVPPQQAREVFETQWAE